MDVRVAMIGLGLRGSLAIQAHRPGRGGRLVAVCDLLPERIEAFRRSHNLDLDGETDYRALLERPDIDAVIVGTPDHTHVDIGVSALDAGKAVYMEKPLAITVEGCDTLLAAARATRSRLYVGHNMRHFAFVTIMRDLIAKGAIGEPRAVWVRHFVGHGGDFYFKDWHADRRNTTGLLLQKGAHDIDIIHWLAGGYSRQVQAMGALQVYGEITDRQAAPGMTPPGWFDPERNWPPLRQRQLHPVVDVEDHSMVHMALDNGVLASYEQCHFAPDYWRNYTVIGTEGRIENCGDVDGEVRLWNRRSGYEERGHARVRFRPDAGGHGGADPRIMREFLRFVAEGGRTDTSPVAAREAVATAVVATESLRSGGGSRPVPAPHADLARYFAEGQPGSR